jgi:hypothetical protein
VIDGQSNQRRFSMRAVSHGFWAWALPGLVCTALLPGLAAGQCQRAKLVAPDGAILDRFGLFVAIDGATAAVAAPFDDDYGSNSGAIYIFADSPAGWELQVKLTLPDGKPGDGFGQALVLSADTLATTCFPRYAVIVLKRAGPTEWEQTDFLSVGFGYKGFFGWSLGLSPSRLAAGAPNGSEKAGAAGAAFIFERGPNGTWSAPIKLLAVDGQAGDSFGDAVAVSGNIAVIGAQDDDDLGNWSGSAYVFERLNGAWVQTAKLLPKDGTVFWNFGTSVAVADDVVLVGATGAGIPGAPACGAVYAYGRAGAGGWVQVAKLSPADPINSGRFGSSLALEGNVALIGAESDSHLAPAGGAAYVFVRQPDGTWVQEAKLVAGDVADYDWFGHSVALSGNAALIGAYQDDDSVPAPGKAYIFAVGPDDDGDGVMDACETPGDLNCDGGVDAFDIDPFVLALTDPASYTAKYPQCTLVNADCNGDGKVDAFDIDPFVALLTGP